MSRPLAVFPGGLIRGIFGVTPGPGRSRQHRPAANLAPPGSPTSRWDQYRALLPVCPRDSAVPVRPCA